MIRILKISTSGWLPAAWFCLAASFCAADSITIDEVLYDGVYVRESANLYYVELPTEGRVISVHKDKINKEDIAITRDRKQRAKLHRTWQANRPKHESPPADAATADTRIVQKTSPPKAAPIKPAAPSQTRPCLTADGVQFRTARSDKPVFMGKDGVAVLTDQVDKYRNKPEFIELSLTFDIVEPPKKYRRWSPREYTPAVIAELTQRYAMQYGLDESLVLAVIRCESNFNPYAVSRAGARGLMQLMPATAAEMGITDIFDPAQNIAGGAQYLAKMLALFGNNVRLALAAYNAGPGAVKKHGGIPPYEETQAYVKRVLEHRSRFAAHDESLAYVADAKNLGPAFLPDTAEKTFLIRFHNGLTQRADQVLEDGDYYIAKLAGHVSRVNKQHVAEVTAPA